MTALQGCPVIDSRATFAIGATSAVALLPQRPMACSAASTRCGVTAASCLARLVRFGSGQGVIHSRRRRRGLDADPGRRHIRRAGLCDRCTTDDHQQHEGRDAATVEGNPASPNGLTGPCSGVPPWVGPVPSGRLPGVPCLERVGWLNRPHVWQRLSIENRQVAIG